jgi:enterochelin esterase-like enzyme
LTFALPQPWPSNPWPTRFRTVRASPPDSLDPGSSFLTVQSPALRGRGDLGIHVPQSVAMPENVPIVVLLHGVYGSFWNWFLAGRAHVALDRLVEAGSVAPMVLVTPSDGMSGEGTAYLRHHDRDYEKWIIDDVVDVVREFVDAATETSPLFLGGNSMGGFGAARLGLRHADRVAGIAMHSAITHLDQLAHFTTGDVATEAGLDPAERDLLTAVDRCSSDPPPIYLDCGAADPLAMPNLAFQGELARREVDYEAHTFDGGHDWDAWSNRIEHSLVFFDRIDRESA